MKSKVLCTLLLTATTALAQSPISHPGDSSPTGTYRSDDYCKPFHSNAYESACTWDARRIVDLDMWPVAAQIIWLTRRSTVSLVAAID